MVQPEYTVARELEHEVKAALLRVQRFLTLGLNSIEVREKAALDAIEYESEKLGEKIKEMRSIDRKINATLAEGRKKAGVLPAISPIEAQYIKNMEGIMNTKDLATLFGCKEKEITRLHKTA